MQSATALKIGDGTRASQEPHSERVKKGFTLARLRKLSKSH